MDGIVERLKRRVRRFRKEMQVKKAHRRVDRAMRDPRITFPCYKPLDEFIDVERLKSLDGYLTERIGKYIEAGQEEKFFTGTATMDVRAPKRPGSRVIHLTQSTRPYRYHDLNVGDISVPTKEAAEFTLLMDFIDTLPFKKMARMLIMYDDSGNAVPAHRDHSQINISHEFIWFRTNLTKPFFMFYDKTKSKRYVETYSAWFDTCNQFHGVDAGKPVLSFSLRVDGVFSDELRARIPVPAYNRASTASLWACVGDNP